MRYLELYKFQILSCGYNNIAFYFCHKQIHTVYSTLIYSIKVTLNLTIALHWQATFK